MSSISLRLTHKISAIGIVGVIGVVLVGAIHMYGEAATSGYRAAAEDARSIAELNDKVEIELLEGRRAEKDFLLRNDSKRADRQIEISKSVAADMDSLRAKVGAAGKPDLARQIEAMGVSLKQYQGHFALGHNGDRHFDDPILPLPEPEMQSRRERIGLVTGFAAERNQMSRR